MDKVEDRSICAECGGYCCKKSGCDYFVSDLESMKINYLESILDTGRVSVIATCVFKRLPNQKLINTPVLSLRARNINRDAIDLISFKTTCASLQEDGCYFNLEDRPSGGASLIPSRDKACYSNIDRLDELEKWKAYQDVLRKLVKKRTGKSIYAKISEDVEVLFYNIMTKNIDDVAPAELYDVMKNMVPLLMEAYPNEYNHAKSRIPNPSAVIMKKTIFNNK